MAKSKIRIAILGGGISSLTTAFYLTRDARFRAHFDLTVYQQGWRLGGKCASGRDTSRDHRIEEHGLHVWMGFYQHSFRMIQDCYREYARIFPDARFKSWRDAFSPMTDIVLREHRVGTNGELTSESWRIPFPPDGADPGSDGWPTVWQMIQRTVEWVTRHAGETLFPLQQQPAVQQARALLGAVAPSALLVPLPTGSPQEVADRLQAFMPVPVVPIDMQLLGSIELSRRVFQGDEPPASMRSTFETFTLATLKALQLGMHLLPVPADRDGRRIRVLLELGAAIAIGLIEDKILWTGNFEGQDHLDFRAWLSSHGCANHAVDSAAIRACYDLIFSGPAALGEAPKFPVAAGSGLRRVLLMVLGYKGALYYLMNAGMADTVISPLYEVLKCRGVKFEFFSRIKKLHATGPRITSITIQRQVHLAEDVTEYRPTYDFQGLRCWPNAPFFEQLEPDREDFADGGRELEWDQNSLEDIADEYSTSEFDEVVLGISAAALPSICDELTDTRLQSAIAQSTVATHAAQIWFDKTPAELGYDFPPIVTAYQRPFDTLANLSHTLGQERPSTAKSVFYICGPDHAHPVEEGSSARMSVLGRVGTWVDGTLTELLGTSAATIRAAMHSWSGQTSQSPLFEQHASANFAKSSQYVLATPDNLKVRIASDGTSYENLFLAGDWVKTRLNGGFVEAAVTAGIQAADAILRKHVPSPLIRRGGDPFQRGPFSAQGAKLFSFVVKAQQTSLERLCSALNSVATLPEEVRYQPALSAVIVQFASLARIQSLHVEDALNGWTPELDASIWVPVLRKRNGQPEALLFYLPYTFVDSGSALIIGRELFGYTKQLATITMPVSPQTADLFEAKTEVLHPKGSTPQNAPKVDKKVVMEVTRNPLASSVSSSFGEIGPAISGLLAGELLDPSVGSLITRLLRPRLVFLKQNMDVEDSRRSSHQVIVEADLVPVSTPRWGLFVAPPLIAPFTVRLGDFDSHPLRRDLGCGTDEPALVAAWTETDFELQHGVEIK
jgi:uncharacterized protein with NAD-binding domain and iron-sulfur cluster